MTIVPWWAEFAGRFLLFGGTTPLPPLALEDILVVHLLVVGLVSTPLVVRAVATRCPEV